MEERRRNQGMAGLRPGKAGQKIGARGLAKHEGGDEGGGAPARAPRQGEGGAPEEREPDGKPYQRERRHPAMAGDIDEEGFDDPVEREREIAASGGEADPERAFPAGCSRGEAQHRIEQRKASDGQRPEVPGRLPQRRQRPEKPREDQAVARTQPRDPGGDAAGPAVSHPYDRAGGRAGA